MWQFRRQAQRQWYWREVDEMGRLLRRSAQYFRERIDCVAHAMQHGYVHPRQRALVARRMEAAAPPRRVSGIRPESAAPPETR
jgi:hypothetical protein